MNYRYLAIDFGESYVGLSVSNGIIPTPLPVFKYPNKNYHILREHLLKIVNINKISFIIIGIPSDEKSFTKIRDLFFSLIFKETYLKLKIIWVNEDYSTIEAVEFKNRKRMREDSIAASIILNRFLLQKEGIYMNDNNITKRITDKDYKSLIKRINELKKSKELILEKRKLVDGDISENGD